MRVAEIGRIAPYRSSTPIGYAYGVGLNRASILARSRNTTPHPTKYMRFALYFAGGENRTRAYTLEVCHSTTKLHPRCQKLYTKNYIRPSLNPSRKENSEFLHPIAFDVQVGGSVR